MLCLNLCCLTNSVRSMVWGERLIHFHRGKHIIFSLMRHNYKGLFSGIGKLELFNALQFSSAQACSVSNSLQPHESQHVRPPCPSPTPGVHSDSCPSSQWCHPAISSSVVNWVKVRIEFSDLPLQCDFASSPITRRGLFPCSLNLVWWLALAQRMKWKWRWTSSEA